MPDFKTGEIILIKFPYTDNQKFKKRPALIINDTLDGDVIVCRITSKAYNSIYDVQLPNWKHCGLQLPSVIRVHKIASVDKQMIDLKLGEIDIQTKNRVIQIFTNFFR